MLMSAYNCKIGLQIYHVTYINIISGFARDRLKSS